MNQHIHFSFLSIFWQLKMSLLLYEIEKKKSLQACRSFSLLCTFTILFQLAAANLRDQIFIYLFCDVCRSIYTVPAVQIANVMKFNANAKAKLSFCKSKSPDVQNVLTYCMRICNTEHVLLDKIETCYNTTASNPITNDKCGAKLFQ